MIFLNFIFTFNAFLLYMSFTVYFHWLNTIVFVLIFDISIILLLLHLAKKNLYKYEL